VCVSPCACVSLCVCMYCMWVCLPVRVYVLYVSVSPCACVLYVCVSPCACVHTVCVCVSLCVCTVCVWLYLPGRVYILYVSATVSAFKGYWLPAQLCTNRKYVLGQRFIYDRVSLLRKTPTLPNLVHHLASIKGSSLTYRQVVFAWINLPTKHLTVIKTKTIFNIKRQSSLLIDNTDIVITISTKTCYIVNYCSDSFCLYISDCFLSALGEIPFRQSFYFSSHLLDTWHWSPALVKE
jgi:hypothetical protein